MCIVWFLQNGSHLITPDINALHKTSHGRSWSLSCADDQHLNAQHRDVNPFTVQNVCYSTLYWLVHRDPLLWCYVQLNRMTVYHINLYCQLDYQGLITENFKLHTFRSLKISGSWQRWSFFAVVEARTTLRWFDSSSTWYASAYASAPDQSGCIHPSLLPEPWE